MKALSDEGAIVSAYDPEAIEKARAVLPDVHYCTDPYEAAQGADAVLVVTEWDEFRQIDWDRLSTVVERQLIVDCRNMLDASEAAGHGFHYFSTGRPPVLPVQTSSVAIGTSSLAGAGSPV